MQREERWERGGRQGKGKINSKNMAERTSNVSPSLMSNSHTHNHLLLSHSTQAHLYLQQLWILLPHLLQECLQHAWVLSQHLTQGLELWLLPEEIQWIP